MKHLLLGLVMPGLFLVLAACSGTSSTTHQTSTPPPPVSGRGDPNARPVIYDSTTGGAYTLPKEEPIAESVPMHSPTTDTMATTTTGSVISYTVQPGDSLWKIANTHRTTVMKIRGANNLTGDVIRPGQVLQVPVP